MHTYLSQIYKIGLSDNDTLGKPNVSWRTECPLRNDGHPHLKASALASRAAIGDLSDMADDCFSAAQLGRAASLAADCEDCAACAAARVENCDVLLRCRLPTHESTTADALDGSSSSSLDDVAVWTDLAADANASARSAFWSAVGNKMCVYSVRFWCRVAKPTNMACKCKMLQERYWRRARRGRIARGDARGRFAAVVRG